MWYVFCFLTCIVIWLDTTQWTLIMDKEETDLTLLSFTLCTCNLAFSKDSIQTTCRATKNWIVPYSLKFFSTIFSYPRLPGFLSLFLNSSSTEESNCDLLIVLFPASSSGMLLQRVNEVVIGSAYFSSREQSSF